MRTPDRNRSTTANTFDVEITFIGIFGVVPDTEVAPTKLALLVPNADSMNVTSSPAQDGEPRARHRWFVEFDPRQLADPPAGLPPHTLAHWNLSDLYEFRRLTFDCPGACDLNVGRALDYVADFQQVAPHFAQVPLSSLGWTPGTEVAGQVMFDKGQLVEPKTEECQQWIFPPTLRPGGAYDALLHHNLRLTLAGVTRFELLARAARDLAQGDSESLELRGTAQRPVKLAICNLCDVNPLRWPNTTPPEIDDDFRWYYELSANEDELQFELMGLDLPVPHPSGQPNALGQNCLGTKYAAQDFDID